MFATDASQADALGKQWRDFFYVGEDENPRTVKEQNAWLSERQCLKAELVELGGKPFKPDNRGDALKAAQSLGFDLNDTIEKLKTRTRRARSRTRSSIVGGIGSAPDYTIKSIETKRTTSRPSPPFITSTMQQQASTRLGFQLKRTMRVAQQLYEGIDLKGARGQTGLITYMRTDSTHLSKEALASVRSHIESKLRQGVPARETELLQVLQQGRAGGPRGDPPDRRVDHARLDPRQAQRRAVQALRPDLEAFCRLPDGPRAVGLDRDHDPKPRTPSSARPAARSCSTASSR